MPCAVVLGQPKIVQTAWEPTKSEQRTRAVAWESAFGVDPKNSKNEVAEITEDVLCAWGYKEAKCIGIRGVLDASRAVVQAGAGQVGLT